MSIIERSISILLFNKEHQAQRYCSLPLTLRITKMEKMRIKSAASLAIQSLVLMKTAQDSINKETKGRFNNLYL